MRFKDRDLARFFESLRPARVGFGYTKADRFHDFRECFSTPAGRRVLHQIIDHCEGRPVVETDVEATHVMAWRAGRREPGLWIVQMMNAQPLEEPERTTHEDSDG